LSEWKPLGFQLRPEEVTEWEHLFRLRELALPELEKARQAKQIGKALDAKLVFTGPAGELANAMFDQKALQELLNVSQLEVVVTEREDLEITVSKAAGEKCERCWHWETDVGSHAEHPTLCARCVSAVS
jgi:isoleucyl-tRNA synthetase